MPYKNPEIQKEYKREWARIKRAGDFGTPCGTQLPLPFKLKTAQDLLALIEEQINAVREEEKAKILEKARVVGYLAGIALKAVEVAGLEIRVEALEQVIMKRKVPLG